MCRCADHILEVFHSPGYEDAVPGHEEIELALVKLADVAENEKYRDMALEFVDRRGTSDYLSNEHLRDRFIDCWYDRNPYHTPYGQAHLPVRQQTTAEGHAVRALYLYSAMADLAWHYGDDGLKNACLALYRNIVERRMYITGGVGSSGTLERFTTDYDLPNDTGYSESCASIGLAMFCKRMTRLTGEARFMDTAEPALSNTVLAGVAMGGKSFFYVNPLAVNGGPVPIETEQGYAVIGLQGREGNRDGHHQLISVPQWGPLRRAPFLPSTGGRIPIFQRVDCFSTGVML